MSKLANGLSSKQAKERLAKFGPNELEKKEGFSDLSLLLEQFKSPLVYVLVLAGIVTLLLHETSDAIVIFMAVFLNTALGFYQERKAQKALQALRGFLVQETKVVRDGKRQMVETTKLVPGDVVILAMGNRVPADGILFEATDFSVNEAILTGESMPVEKENYELSIRPELMPRGIKNQEFRNLHAQVPKSQQVFMGTTVTSGIGKMIVTGTGMDTKMGKIGAAVKRVKIEKTPLQNQLNTLAKTLAILVAVASVLIFAEGLIKGKDPVEMFETSVAIAVAAIPEGLVITLTVILALGMQRILKRKALVRKLVAAETLGSVSVVCADKTGTLTRGKMTVTKAETTDMTLIELAAILCNDLRDPLEQAMWDWIKEKGKNPEEIYNQNPRVDGIPFSSEEKYIATLNEVIENDRKERLVFISGAPEIVLDKCQPEDHEFEKWQEKFVNYGKKGLRLVGFAYKKVGDEKMKVKKEDLNDFVWLGILIYEDAIRKGVKKALEEVKKAQIEVKVITGDYPTTAVGVMKRLGFEVQPEQVLTGDQLAKIPPQELKEKIGKILLFARTDPGQKLKIVEALKQKGEVVAMMGDGVNDAPALVKSDIGIVVGEASDVAKETADMVLLDSRFNTIVHAIEEGRVIFENIKKVVLYLLSDSFTEIILVSGALLMNLPIPISAAQILWVNLVEDTLPANALAFEPEEKEVMNDPPRLRGAKILDLEMKVLIFVIGIITDLVLLTLVYLFDRQIIAISHAQTVIFVALGIDSLFYVFSCRSLRKTIFQKGILGNKLLLFSVILGLGMLVLAVYLPFLQTLLETQPLDFVEWIFLLGLGVFKILLIEATKWAFIVRRKTGNMNE